MRPGRPFIGAIAALGCLAPCAIASAQAAMPAVTPYQVVRAGDGAMTCEALIAEISTLTTEVQTLQNEMTAASNQISQDALAAMGGGGRGAAGLGMGLANAAAGFIPGASLFTGALANARQQAAQAAMLQRQREMTNRGASMGEALNSMTPIMNRLSHLSEISRGKNC